MKQMIKIIRKADIERMHIKGLKEELDYLLASLHDAIERGDKAEAKKLKKRLSEVRNELEKLDALD